MFNKPNFYAFGISMGSGCILVTLGEEKEETRFSAAVCIAAPFDLEMAVKSIEYPGNEYINFGLIEGLQENVLNNYDYLKTVEEEVGFDLDRVLKMRSVRDFHREFIAKINGFETDHEFYKKNSCTHYV
jgi:predicted alpha/beta-fold hydrolase